jgi:hypothetical protein
MTTIVASRPRHRTGRGAAQQAPAPTAAPARADLIAWREESDGVWVGRLDHLLDAGAVRRTPAGYAVEAWDGTPEGLFSTLAAAQRSLEPAYRAWLREQEEEPGSGVLGRLLAVTGLTALAASAVTGLLTAFPL